MAPGLALTALSVLSLFLGAFLPRWLKGGHWPGLWQGLVLGAVGGLVALVVIPETVREAGPLALLLALLGVALPSLLESWGAKSSGLETHLTLGAALVALLLHTALDGLGLASAARPGSSGPALALAIIAHRFPVGLALWMITVPRHGTKGGLLVLGLVGLTTFIGYGLGDLVLPAASGLGVQLFQAFVAGSLFHVLLHTPEVPRNGVFRWPELIGTAVGLALVFLLPDAHAHAPGARDLHAPLIEMAARAAPAVVVGFALSALLPIALGHQPSWGAFLRRVGLEPPALLLSFVFLGVPIALFGFLTRVVITAVGRRLGPTSNGHEDRDATPNSKLVLRTLADSVDANAPWLVFGLVVSASITPGAGPSWLPPLPTFAVVVLFAAIGLCLRLSAISLMPLAAALIAAGLSPGAALAFVVTGPGFAAVPAKGDRPRTRALRTMLLLILAVGVGLLTNQLGLVAPADDAGPMMRLGRFAALVIAGVLILWSLARQGTRSYLSTILRTESAHEH